MKKFIQLSCLIAIMAGLTLSCKTQEVSSEQPGRKITYSKYETYQFGRSAVLSSENPVFSWSQFEERVQREIEFILPTKGLEKATVSPDLLVYYYAIADRDSEYSILNYTIGWAAEPFVANGHRLNRYPPNTFVIDLVDTDTDQLIWRSSTPLPFDDRDQLYKVLAERLRNLLEPYPNVPKQ